MQEVEFKEQSVLPLSADMGVEGGAEVSVSRVVEESEEVRDKDVGQNTGSTPVWDDKPIAEPVAQDEIEVKSASAPGVEQVDFKMVEWKRDNGDVVIADEKPSSEPHDSDMPGERVDQGAVLETGTQMVPTGEPAPRQADDEASINVVDLISRQNHRLDTENERLREEIMDLQSFCQTRGLLKEAHCEEVFGELARLQLHEDVSDRNRELRAEHEHLRATLGSFCRGLTELAGRMNNAVSPTPAEGSGGTSLPVTKRLTLGLRDPPTMPSRSETLIAEEDAAAACEKLEQEQKILMAQIKELEARKTPSPAPL